jgi:hypothetical protein
MIAHGDNATTQQRWLNELFGPFFNEWHALELYPFVRDDGDETTMQQAHAVVFSTTFVFETLLNFHSFWDSGKRSIVLVLSTSTA